MVIKLIIILLLLFILFSLFKALLIMMRADPKAPSMSQYLGRRVLISVLVLLCILIAMAFGWITPNQNPFIKHKQIQTNTATLHLQNANTKQQLEKQNDSQM
ncbi:DUF2909 domain-containing protein [Pseudoalteromonas ulvae]|uniref:DUF2909 domain-containing protein n=1 Tax=Pseudoalteromonas ulvae TaxID=107327 RepID=A0A244CWU2_PSEDV|nr:DUF2909 domain-containing protein [Pseudoalteromonas ulvae]OUL59719.1 hypothetical protein B1199_05755 [Pseudoalteromonas ulvae]